MKTDELKQQALDTIESIKREYNLGAQSHLIIAAVLALVYIGSVLAEHLPNLSKLTHLQNR